MKDANITRPKVTKVKVTVKSSITAPTLTCSEILFTLDGHVTPQNFPHTPTLKLNSNELYKTVGVPVCSNVGSVHTAKYSATTRIFDIAVNVEGSGPDKPIQFEYVLEEGNCI